MPASEEELETRRIILLRHSRGTNLEVLLGLEATLRRLPEVLISGRQRVAEQLAAACKQRCGMDPVSVSALEALSADPPSDQIAYEIMAPRHQQDEPFLSWQWLSIDSLGESDFQNRNDLQAIKRAMTQSTAAAEDTCPGPFARLGWFEELEQWVKEQIAPRGLHLTGGFRQLNASPTFSLIRFKTDGPAVWFKATGVPNVREFRLTQTLSHLFPRFLPPLISTRPEWNGWLAVDVEGSHVDEAMEPTAWFKVAGDLAEFEAASSASSLLLIQTGARDLRLHALRNRVEPFFQAMNHLMERQTKTYPRALSRNELQDIATQVVEALAIMEEQCIPATLGHLDLNPGNIICSAGGSVFLDWAEGFVGHPFLTFEYLLEFFRKSGGNETDEAQLLVSYSEPWLAFLSHRAIRRAFEMAPLVAVFAYAARNELGNQARTIEDPPRAASLRSLTRRMHREARVLAERSVRCRH